MAVDFHVDFPLKDLLFALRGFPGDIFCDVNGKLTMPDIIREYFHPAEVGMAKKILHVASEHFYLSEYMSSNRIVLCPYQSEFLSGIKTALKGYESTIEGIEADIYGDHLTPLSRCMQILRFGPILEVTGQLIRRFRRFNGSAAVTELLNGASNLSIHSDSEVKESYERISNNLVHAFCDDLWSFLIFGLIHSDNRFFIREFNDARTFQVDDQKPSFVTETTAEKMIFLGRHVRWFLEIAHQGGKFCVPQVYESSAETLYDQLQVLRSKRQLEAQDFSCFIEKVRCHAVHFSAVYAIEQEGLLEKCSILKDFYLTSNENLWNCLVARLPAYLDQSSYKWTPAKKNRRLRKLMEKLLTEGFYRQPDEIEKLMDSFKFDFEEASPELNTRLPVIYMDFRLSPLLQQIFKSSCFKDYHKMLNFMLQLYHVRIQLNDQWRQSIKDKFSWQNGSGDWHLRHKLTSLLEQVYYFFKVNVIERLSMKFVEEIKSCDDYEVMATIHSSFVASLRRESLLNLPAVETAFFELFSICHQLCAGNFRENIETEQVLKNLSTVLKQLYYLLNDLKTLRINPTLSQLVFQLSGFFSVK